MARKDEPPKQKDRAFCTRRSLGGDELAALNSTQCWQHVFVSNFANSTVNKDGRSRNATEYRKLLSAAL